MATRNERRDEGQLGHERQGYRFRNGSTASRFGGAKIGFPHQVIKLANRACSSGVSIRECHGPKPIAPHSVVGRIDKTIAVVIARQASQG